MRELSTIDKQIINRIIQASEEHDLQNLQVARLLRNELSVFAVEWSVQPSKISVYAPRHNNKPDFNRIQKNYIDISYFLYLIDELEKCGYIKLQSVISSNNSNIRELYDRERYKKEGDTYIEKIGENILAFISVDYSFFNLDVVDLLEKYAFKIIFPLPCLKEFKDRGYLTEEQKFRREEIELSRKSVSSAKWATWAAAIGTLLAAISTIKSCSDSNELNINEADLNKIEEIVNKPTHVLIDDAQFEITDTIKIRSVDKKNPLPINLNVKVNPTTQQ